MARRRRKMRLAGVLSERFTLEEIILRDGHVCGICGEQVDSRLTVPDSGAPTVDHIVPIARGGSDTRENVQLAHFICNSRKADHLDYRVAA